MNRRLNRAKPTTALSRGPTAVTAVRQPRDANQEVIEQRERQEANHELRMLASQVAADVGEAYIETKILMLHRQGKVKSMIRKLIAQVFRKRFEAMAHDSRLLADEYLASVESKHGIKYRTNGPTIGPTDQQSDQQSSELT